MDDSRFVTISRTMTPTGTVVEVAGELDAGAGPQLRRVLIAAIVTGGTVEIDLSGVTFADSSGLSALVDAKRFAGQYRVGLAVTATTAPVRRLLQLTGVTELYGDEQAPAAHTA